MTEPSDKQQAITLYQVGKDAFERGRYRESVQHLTKASALVGSTTRLGGEIQIWLVTAYEAAGQTQEAIALCRRLDRHPNTETRKQSRRLLYILEAPKLSMRPEWLSQIPDLSGVSDSDTNRGGSRSSIPKSRPVQQPSDPAVDLSQVNTKDNQFLWAALIVLILVVGGLVWLS